MLVVLEGLADSIGVWASVRPLGRGLSGRESVQLALAGDFFDILSPAGPVSSEPIMARFISVATGTGYSDALGVRTVAKYLKSGAQLTVSVTLGIVMLFGAPQTDALLITLIGAVGGLLLVGIALVRLREYVSSALVVLTPVVRWISSLCQEDPHERSVAAAAVERFWTRILDFRGTPRLLVLIAVGGVIEQVLTATALWVALAGSANAVVFLPILVIILLPQVVSVVPIPGSLGTYDVLLSGALTLVTGAPTTATAAAVLIVRTIMLPFGAAAGGLSVAFLRGWRPSTGAS